VLGAAALSLLLTALLPESLVRSLGGGVIGGRGFQFGALLYVLLLNAFQFLPLLVTALQVGRIREASRVSSPEQR
jgi:hypothetical protein